VDAPPFRTKNRIFPDSTLTHIGAVVAELPAGSVSDRTPAPLTAYASFPATTRAPPVNVQLVAPPSKPPFGASL
jgi:hypothetical protein